MVMNFGTYDINLHMLNHYKRINSAKNVLHTRSRKKNAKCSSKTGSVASVHSRNSTPVFAGGNRAESSQSNYQHINLKPEPKQRRAKSASVKSDTKHSTISEKSTSNDNEDVPTCPNNTCTSLCLPNPIPSTRKTPVPTPRTIIHNTDRSESSVAPEFEYLQFSLRITEDIISNDLYTNKQMQRVFNSHIEANRGRLSMKKMLEQIDGLCTELNIGKKESEKSRFYIGDSDSESIHNQDQETNKLCHNAKSKNEIINKILSGEKLMSDEDIQKLNENELDDVIGKLLSSHEINEEDYNKNEKMYSIDCSDLFRKPELTVEEVIELSLEDNITNTQIIKHDLLNQETERDDFVADISPSQFDLERYLKKKFPKMGVDASVQTTSEYKNEDNIGENS